MPVFSHPAPKKHPRHAPIDPVRVRTLFCDPARVADSLFLRREIARRLYERLSVIKIDPRMVLDVGCGEGADIVALQKHFAQATLFGIDASSGMLSQASVAQKKGLSALSRMLRFKLPVAMHFKPDSMAALLCGDFARMPLADNSMDMLWSNLALHWHAQPQVAFSEWHRILKQEGLLLFSAFGPDTFKELRTAFASEGHVLPFIDMHDLGDMLLNAGFSMPVMDMEMLTVTYDTTQKLLADVRAMGGNPLDTRRRGLQGRTAWRHIIHRLEKQRRDIDGKIPLTIEVAYGHAFRPAPRTTSSDESVIRFHRPQK